VLWDIGAGSGSVGIEAKLVSPALKVYAFEKDASRVEDIRHNAHELKAGEINVFCGEAPDVFKEAPAPNRVFIGGGGAGLKNIIRAAWKKMDAGGILVASTITIESLSEAIAELKKKGPAPEVTSLLVSRSKDVGGREYLKAENQIFLIKAIKK
jgi:precorrin-6Y C5,15-methyltransferase (decarboxylating)